MKTHTTKSLEEVHATVDTTNKKGLWKSFLAFIGPAYLVSVGYMDPGNWATDLAGGSAFGYKLIWVLLMANLMAILLQSHCTRLGIVRGQDLAQASKETYPPFINIPLYILAEIAIAACDLAEVLGLAIGLYLLFDIPLLWGVGIAVLDCLLLLVFFNFGIRKMEAFIVSMVFIIGMSFLVEIFMAKPDMAEVAKGFIPNIPNETALYITIGIIGATVMPHNLYLHSALVQTRKFDRSESGLWKAIRYNFIDSVIALNLAFFVNAGILILAAALFFRNGYFEIADIMDAHKLLEPLLGTKLAPVLFAVALIASGQSSTITGTLAGQIVMEGYLHLRITPWLRRLITRLLAVIPAFLAIWLYGDQSTGELLILSQVILSMQLGFAVIPLIHFVSDKKKMGKYAINNSVKILSWLIALIIITLNVKLVVEEIFSLLTKTDNAMWIYLTIIPVAALIGILLLYITLQPLFHKEGFISRGLHAGREMVISETKKFSRIAVAVDFSETDSATISQAVALGQKEAVYCLIHILESPGALLFGEKISDKEAKEDEQQLNEYAASLLEQGYVAEIKLGMGRRSKNIARLTNDFNADLLVMGGHGHRRIKDLIFGETINEVRDRLTIPVLAVK